MNKWQLQDAKARFSKLVQYAREEGPQEVTVRGKPAAVVLSVDDYQRLKKKPLRFVDFMRHSPLRGVEIRIERNASATRDNKF